MRTLYLILIALLVTPVAMAGRERTLAVSAITSQQAEIRSGVQAGNGRYRDMPATIRNELLKRQDQVLTALEGKVSSAELDEEDRLLVFNNLEWIEAAINREEGDEMVCKREKKLGSNRAERICKTARQIEEEKEYARMNMNSGCAGGVCGNP